MNWITVLGAIASVFTILSGICTLCLFLSRKDSDGKEKDCRRIHVEGFGNRCVVVQLSLEREDIPGGNGTPHVRKMPGSEAGPVRKMAGSLIPCSLLYGKGKEVSAERRCQLDGFMLCYA